MRKYILGLLLLCFATAGSAQPKNKTGEVPEKKYRILSVSVAENIILISDLDSKNRMMLDASKAKITIEGKSADLKSLQQYSSASFQVKLSTQALRRGHELDGYVVRITVDNRR